MLTRGIGADPSGRKPRPDATIVQPIEQLTKFELVSYLKTAKTLGLTILASLLLRADQVIGTRVGSDNPDSRAHHTMNVASRAPRDCRASRWRRSCAAAPR
jgi:hypothetical protein